MDKWDEEERDDDERKDEERDDEERDEEKRKQDFLRKPFNKDKIVKKVEDFLEDEERDDDLTEEKRNEELKVFLTEYKPMDKEGVVESVPGVLKGRVQFAIMDQIEHMIYAAEIGNPNEIKKLIFRDVQLYIEEYRSPESNSEEGDEDSLK